MSAYNEFINRALQTDKIYEELPLRIRENITLTEWRNRVVEFCIGKGKAYATSLASTVCGEQEYYDELMKAYRSWQRTYPYHLAEYVCRVQRTTPHRYYCDILTSMLREEKSYDRMPNFTAADIVHVLGIGRNEYIAMLNQCKGRRFMWRINPRGLARELLPAQPNRPQPQPWWLVSVVNITEGEYRDLSPDEVANLKTANAPMSHALGSHPGRGPGGRGGYIRSSDLNADIVAELYRRGLIYFDIPVGPDDRVSIPPLEGFVSNRTPTSSDTADPLEAMLYSIFVASSESLKVSDLAQILNAPLGEVQSAISLALRLGFATLITSIPVGLDSRQFAVTMVAPDGKGGGNSNLIDLDEGNDGGYSIGGGGLPSTSIIGSTEIIPESSGGGGAGEIGRAVALLLDAEATSYLMMGALSPGLKRHSVTLFEGGRVAGEAIMAELLDELWQSYEAGQGFEGDMLKLTHFVGALATTLEALREGSGNRPLELLRKESLAGLPPPAARKVLYHAYCAVVPAAPLPGPPLPLVPDGPDALPGPAYFGPLGSAAGPWLQLALYLNARCGPRSMILVRGQRLHTLPPELCHRCSHALIWPWQATDPRANGGDGAWASAVAAAASEGSGAVLTEAQFLLYMLNEALVHTAVMVQPFDGFALISEADGAASTSARASAATEAEDRLASLDHTAEALLPSSGSLTGEDVHQSHPRNQHLLDDSGWDDRSRQDHHASIQGVQRGHQTARERESDTAAGHPAVGAVLVDIPLPLETSPSNTSTAVLSSNTSHPPSQGSQMVQGIERHSSSRGKSVHIPLSNSVKQAVGNLGLSQCPGVLRMIMVPLGPQATRASYAANCQGSQKEEVFAPATHQWVPLSVCLGLPLHCLPLCRAVCARALVSGFLTQDGRESQLAGQATMQAALHKVISDHALDSTVPSQRSGGGYHQSGGEVTEPLFNMFFNGTSLQRC